MGTIIGRQGLKIKQIQDVSGARMVASKDMLPQSTERVVEVQGTTEAVKVAILEIGRCLLEDYERGQGTVLYHPGAGGDTGVLAGGGAAVPGLVVGAARRASAGFGLPQGGPMGAFGAPRRASAAAGALGSFQQQPQQQQQQLGQIPQQQQQQQQQQNQAPKQAPSAAQSATASAPESSLRTQNISIPSDMVGCIIGRAGSKITEIRRLSGSKISIAKVPHDETGERMFTIVGTAESKWVLSSKRSARRVSALSLTSFPPSIALLARRPSSCSTTSSRARRRAGSRAPRRARATTTTKA